MKPIYTRACIANFLNYLFILSFLLLFNSSVAQSPGGVGSTRFWIKANQSVFNDGSSTPATNSQTIQVWGDISGNASNLSQTTGSLRPTFQNGSANTFNYNPVVSFVNHYLSTEALSSGLFPTGTSYNHINTYAVYKDINSNDMDWLFYQGTNGGDRFSYYFNFNGGASASFDVTTGNRLTTNTTSIIQPNTVNIVAFNNGSTATYGQNSNAKRALMVNGREIAQDVSIPANNTANYSVYGGVNTPFYVGSNRPGTESGDNPFNGYLAELIVINSALTAAQRDQIESYLALKYGKTLDRSAGGSDGNYYSSTGTTIWTANNNNAYHNQVIGIGRDDNSALNQKQSHSEDDITRIYLSSLTSVNQQNAGSISSDRQFLLAGNNGAEMNATNSSEYPTGLGIFSRINREWKLTNTDFTGTFSMDLTLNATPITPSHLRILIDDDGDFTNATMYNPGFVINGSTVTIQNINNTMIPANSTKYLTLVSLNMQTPLPLKLLSFSGQSKNGEILLQWLTTEEQNNSHFVIERSLNGIYWNTLGNVAGKNTSGNHTYNFIDDNVYETVYYRLKQYDIDGTFFYSNIIKISGNNLEGIRLKIWPIPSKNIVTIKWIDDKLKKANMQIYNLQGVIVKQMNIFSGVELNIGGLLPGHYIIKVETEIKKIIIE